MQLVHHGSDYYREEIMVFTGKFTRRMAPLMLAFSAVFPLAGAQAQTIISEVLYDASSTDNGNVFVELFGAPGTLLDGLLLEGVNGADGSVYRSVLLAGTIPSDGVFVIGDDSGDGTSLVAAADLIREVDFQNGPDSVVLRDGGLILDALGYGDFGGGVFAGEGSAAPDVVAGSSLARFDPTVDTHNNLFDFVALELPTPGSVPVSPVPLPPAVLLFLSGIVGLIGIARKQC
jgi:hypothetical protein